MPAEKRRKYPWIIYFIKLLGSPWSLRFFKRVWQGRIGFSDYSNCLSFYTIDQTIQKGISKQVLLLSSQDLQQLITTIPNYSLGKWHSQAQLTSKYWLFFPSVASSLETSVLVSANILLSHAFVNRNQSESLQWGKYNHP